MRRPARANPTRSLRWSIEVEPNCDETTSSMAWISTSRSSPISSSISFFLLGGASVTPFPIVESPGALDPAGPLDPRVQAELTELSGAPLTHANRVRLLRDGADTYTAMLELREVLRERQSRLIHWDPRRRPARRVPAGWPAAAAVLVVAAPIACEKEP